MPRIERVKFPVEAFPPHTAVEGACAFRLESGGEGEPNAWNSWSYDGGPARLLLRCDPVTQMTTLTSAEGVVQQWHDPLDALRWMQQFKREDARDDARGDDKGADGDVGDERADDTSPPFKGGWIGYL